MSYKRKNFGILGGEAKGGASIRLYSYLLDKEETFNDLLATGYFNEERERLLPNDLIKVLMPDKDFKLGYLMVKRVTLDNVEVIKVEIDAKSDLLPLPDSDNGSSGNGDLISRYDHRHPKVIATETERGQIIIASEEETLQGANDTKVITPFKNKLYFNNQQATNEEINNGADVKKYINPLQVKTIKDELQQNINNNTTLINTNKQELDEDISSINQNIVNINSQIQGINTNKANVSLDNINAEGQNVIKGIIKNNIVNLFQVDYSAGISISSNTYTPPVNGVIIGYFQSAGANGFGVGVGSTVSAKRIVGLSNGPTGQFLSTFIIVNKGELYSFDLTNVTVTFYPFKNQLQEE